MHQFENGPCRLAGLLRGGRRCTWEPAPRRLLYCAAFIPIPLVTKVIFLTVTSVNNVAGVSSWMQSGNGWGRAGAEGGRNSPSPQLIQYLCRAGSWQHWPLGRAVKQLPQPLHPNCCTCPLLWRIRCSFSLAKQILMAACAWRWEQFLPHKEKTCFPLHV